MATTLPDNLRGKLIQFQSRNDKDATTWRGTFSGSITPEIAKANDDVIAYNAGVIRNYPTTAAWDQLDYFFLKLDNTATGATQLRVFAVEWIADGTFAVINEKVPVVITVMDAPENDHQTIVNLLRANGYTATLTSVG